MRQRNYFKRVLAIVTGILLASSLEFQAGSGPAQLTLLADSEAYARSSGGRAGGGSFRPSSPRSSGSSSSTRSNSSPSSSTRSNSSSSSPSRSYTRPQVIPVPVGPSIYNDPYRPNSNSSSPTSSSSNQNSDSGDVVLVLVILAVSTIVILAIVGLFFWAVLHFINKAGSTGDDTKVTVSRVQVALLAQAQAIQKELTHLCETIDTETQEGLYQLLQESALLLLRSTENWSHVLASSETVKTLDAATSLFNQLSIEERAKFSVEALSNVGGRVSRREFKPPSDEDPAAYIVATLLLGTSDDKPLFDQVRTAEELQTVLEKIASLPAEQLQVFELLWSPQTENDSLTYDELLTEYTDMAQI